MAAGEEWGSISLVFENSILLIRVQGYRGLTEKLKTVKTVHTIRYTVLKISEYFRGVVFCESFGIYCAANLGIWCSDCLPQGYTTEGKAWLAVSYSFL